jgi:DNA processing protein
VDDEVVARAALCAVASLSRAHARGLIERWGSAGTVVGKSATALATALGQDRAQSLVRRLDLAAARRTLARAADAGMRALAPDAAEFPAALREIPDPPLLLWLCGVLPRGPALAMVGSRRPTARGLACARAFASELARAGVTIVSGLAYGIDGASHEGALAGCGATVAVLASGLDLVTPRGQRGLAERILAGGGAWLSERNPGAAAQARHFPERNRLISGLARVTLVVEAREKSGSLWSARHALEQGRDVAIVPGPIDSDACRGSNRLLREGATPILDAEDLRAAVLGPLAAPGQPPLPEPAGSPAAQALLGHLADGPCDLEQLCRTLGRSPRELAPVLLELELDARIAREGTRVSLRRADP